MRCRAGCQRPGELQWFSTHCQSLTSHQLVGPPGRLRATGRAHRRVTQVGTLWQQIPFSTKQKDLILFALETFFLNNDRLVSLGPEDNDPVVVLNNWLCSSGHCWWGSRIVLTLGRWFLACPKLIWMTGAPFPSYMDLSPCQVQHSLSDQGIS